MTSKPRIDPLDPQRDRLYAVEAEVFGGEKDRTEFLALLECRKLVAEWQSRDWFQSNYPAFLSPIPVRNGKGDKWSRVGRDGRHVQLRRMSRVRDVLGHEVTHVICPSGVEDHGAVFAGMLLFFVSKIYDRDTEAKLRRAFKRNDVVWDRRVARHGRVEVP